MKPLVVLLLLAALSAGGTALWMWYGMTHPYQGFPQEGVFVDVPRGTSSRYVGYILKKNGVVRSKLAFEIYARRHPKRTLQAGEYFFDHAMTGTDVFWKIANGQVFQQPFTVREGETMFDIARELETGKFMRAGDFLYAAGDPSLIRDFAPGAQTLEGFLFPATYELPRHPAASELTTEMVRKFKEEWRRIVSPTAGGPTDEGDHRLVNRIVTLASLVERETPKPEERPLVAGAFENRLRKGMRLQCDPTVIYGMERLGKYNGGLTGKDLQFDSPYNTYEHGGLPPGPIGNPGEASLRAAMHPAQTNYLYFVANTQGGHFFSATLAEHNKNVVKYRRLMAGLPADPPSSPAPPPSPKKKHSKLHRGKAR
ncbi:MAG TPA: endolytic transglycosylase MltG [Candidatus Elarobacter sp.]|nr:endolytic transglycosylase MltG [Candidatus Elarobacter sp.]